ncbi:MAG: hypothetical protein IKY10_03420 [Clostridia bacterium]|nr:hypothetical protein [Clostridia bacterium]
MPKKDLFFIPIIKSSVEHEYFKEVSELINKILENKDLKNQKKFLKSININLKVVTNNSNNIIAELLKMSTTKNVKNQVKKWENKNNDENKNLQV